MSVLLFIFIVILRPVFQIFFLPQGRANSSLTVSSHIIMLIILAVSHSYFQKYTTLSTVSHIIPPLVHNLLLILMHYSNCSSFIIYNQSSFIFQGKFPNSAYWFNQMYYGTNSAFRRSVAGRGLVFSSNILNIKGFMEGNTYHSILNISVTPAR